MSAIARQEKLEDPFVVNDDKSRINDWTKACHEGKAPRAVLVDFFGTVVRRRIGGQDVKRLWAKRIRMAAGILITSEEIFQLRSDLEGAICAHNRSLGHDDEFRYLDMCRALHLRLKQKGAIREHLDEFSFAELAYLAELAVEKDAQVVDEKVIELIKCIRKGGAKVYLLSDFYLGRKGALAMLRAHSLQHLFHDVFVSSDYLLAKRSGRLYERVLSILKLNSSDVWMIGDDPHADRDQALKMGIRPLWLEENWTPSYQPMPQEEGIRGELRQNQSAEQIVFPELPLSLYFFFSELFPRLQRVNPRHVFFISREGVILESMFREFQEQLLGGEVIPFSHLEVSRRSTFLASLGPLDTETFHTLFRQYRRMSARTFLQNLSFSDDLISLVRDKLSVDIEQIHDDFPSTDIFLTVRNSPFFRKVYESERNQQRELLSSYLWSHVRRKKDGPIVLVDVGWKGTIQDHLRAILPTDVDLIGFYIGLVAGDVQPNNLKDGVLFSTLPAPTPFCEVFTNNRSLFEIMLGARRGSVARYGSDGVTAYPEREHCPREEEIFDRYLQSQQEAYLSSFKDTCRRMFRHPYDDWNSFYSFCAATHARMVFHPRSEEVRFIQAIEHHENFGLLNFFCFRPERRALGDRIRNVVRFLKNPEEQLQCCTWWATGLDKLGISALGPLYSAHMLRKVLPSSLLENTRALLLLDILFRVLRRGTTLFARGIK